MSEPLSKEALVRSAWITALRREGHRQCTGGYFGTNKTVCALGLLMEMTGGPRSLSDRKIGRLAGLDHWRTGHVMTMNDGGYGRKHTFSEIADVVEGWFKLGA